MHRSEAAELGPCAECGAEVHVTAGRSYAVDATRVLCFDCALRRGGTYDEIHDVWTAAPDLSALPPGDPD